MHTRLLGASVGPRGARRSTRLPAVSYAAEVGLDNLERLLPGAVLRVDFGQTSANRKTGLELGLRLVQQRLRGEDLPDLEVASTVDDAAPLPDPGADSRRAAAEPGSAAIVSSVEMLPAAAMVSSVPTPVGSESPDSGAAAGEWARQVGSPRF